MKARFIYSGVLACLILIAGCETPSNPEFGSGNPDPNPPGRAAASVTAVSPTEAFFIETITISGTGFDPIPANNLVQIGNGAGTIIAASATELTVELPPFSGVTVPCRVAVNGSIAWSNSVDFTFKVAVSVLANDIPWPMGVEADDEGNVYAGSADEGMIYKIDSLGNRTEFAAAAVWGALRWGPDGNLYVAAANEGQILSITPDGSSVDVYVDGAGSVTDFDWAENGNLYIMRTWGEGIGMYKDGEVTDLISGDDIDAKAGRVFGDNLYVSTGWNSELYEIPITTDGLDTPNLFYEESVLGVEADVDGNIWYTVADNFTMFNLGQDGSEGSLFEDQLEDDAGSHMRYIRSHGKFMYVVYPGWGGEGSVLKVFIGADQAPNWGLP